MRWYSTWRPACWCCFYNEFGEIKLCRILASRFCISQSWDAEFLHYPFVVDFLMNLAGKWHCRVFASRFCKCQSWNAEFLPYPYVVDFLINLAGKWLCRIFASRFCKSQTWNAEFLHYPFVLDVLMNLAEKWLCRIFASRFCKCQKLKCRISALSICCWFFNEFSGNMVMQNFYIYISKLKSRISAWSVFCCSLCNEFSGKMAMQNFASSLQVKMQNFCIIHICCNYFLWFFCSN